MQKLEYLSLKCEQENSEGLGTSICSKAESTNQSGLPLTCFSRVMLGTIRVRNTLRQYAEDKESMHKDNVSIFLCFQKDPAVWMTIKKMRSEQKL